MQVDSCPVEQRAHVTARTVVEERDAFAIRAPRDHLVPEHGSRRGDAELLDVGAAEAGRQDLHRGVGRGQLSEPRLSVLVEHHCAHGRIV